jgi:TolB-like protein/DNA-binding winged helix-turn-helix (wHTH) protein
MPTTRVSNAVRFGPFTLDLKAGELHKYGRKICLQEQPFRLLTVLMERPREVVTREELRNRLWPNDTNVEFSHSINSAIKRLRDVLCDTADKPKYVETVSRRGYRFLLPVEREPISPVDPTASVGEQHTESAVSSTASPVEAVISPPLPGQRLQGQRLTQLLIVLALGGLITALVEESRRFHWFDRPASGRITSLAVLPLENLSGDKGQDYFADGMTDQLISNLGKISALRVISRTSVMRYRGTQKPVVEIARDLHVDAVVEGTVLRSGNRVRITAHLIQAVPEAHVWTENYERDLRDITVLQYDMARQIANEIQVTLTPQEQGRLANAHPVSPQAHEAYLKGRYLFSQWTDQGMEKSIGSLQEAINIDSRYALAYAGLADSYLVLAGHGLLPPE